MKFRRMVYQLMAVYIVLGMALVTAASCQTPAGRTAGEVVDDSTITSNVKAKLLEEGILRGIVVSVETFEGNVTLTGAVDTDDQKKHAEDVAKSVSGVRKVNNLLIIKKKIEV